MVTVKTLEATTPQLCESPVEMNKQEITEAAQRETCAGSASEGNQWTSRFRYFLLLTIKCICAFACIQIFSVNVSKFIFVYMECKKKKNRTEPIEI